ncbi:MAG TPA: hypothetical protein DIT09_01195 [Glutamicibacter sp.]|nr:hypothetical protein [Glutamicibacter sp.]
MFNFAVIIVNLDDQYSDIDVHYLDIRLMAVEPRTAIRRSTSTDATFHILRHDLRKQFLHLYQSHSTK